MKLYRILAGGGTQGVGSADSFLPLAAAVLPMTGTFGLALATGGQGTGAATAVNEMGCLAGVEASDQAAVELQVSFALLL